MAEHYLNKISSKLPSAQGHQIVRTLSKKRSLGEIRTLDELQKKLKELTNELLGTKIQSTFKQYVAIGENDISSEIYNEMMEHIEDDLKIAFEEADNLYDILDTHNMLIKDISLQSIEIGVNRLESELSMYEFLIDTTFGFDNATIETFRNSSGSFIARDSVIAKFVFYDPKKKELFPGHKSAVIDVIGERLTLGDSLEIYLQPKSAQHLSGTYSTRSDENLSYPDSHILNIIDNQRNTFWLNPIFKSNVLYDGAYAEIAIDLPSAQDISFVEIEPATEKPLRLSAIGYLDKNYTTRYIENIDEVLDKEQVRINFNKINTNRLILRFQQKNYNELQVKRSLKSNVGNVLAPSIGAFVPNNTLDTDKEVNNSISNPFLLNTILGLDTSTSASKESIRYFEYDIGLDNIRLGKSQYNDVGIFVLGKKTVEDIRLIGLRTEETRPSQVFGYETVSNSTFNYPARTLTQDDKFYHGSVEYWITLELYNKFGTDIVSVNTFPIFPLNASRIYHEKLEFSHRYTSGTLLNNCGQLAFFCDASISDVIVYKNGLPMTYGQWLFVDDADFTGLTNVTPNAGVPMTRGIRIVTRDKLSDYYTVSYTPKKSTSYSIPPSGSLLMSIVDLSGNMGIRMMPDNTILIDPSRISSTAGGKANVYLGIMLRRNSSNYNISPAVEEVLLATRSGSDKNFTRI